jgi:hypothetical protein
VAQCAVHSTCAATGAPVAVGSIAETIPEIVFGGDAVAGAFKRTLRSARPAAGGDRRDQGDDAITPQSAETLAGLGQAYAAAERLDDLREVLRELEQLSRSRYLSAYSMAKILTVTDRDQAFAWLAKAYEESSADLIELAGELAFAGLRSDPRFRDLVRRIGLTASTR